MLPPSRSLLSSPLPRQAIKRSSVSSDAGRSSSFAPEKQSLIASRSKKSQFTAPGATDRGKDLGVAEARLAWLRGSAMLVWVTIAAITVRLLSTPLLKFATDRVDSDIDQVPSWLWFLVAQWLGALAAETFSWLPFHRQLPWAHVWRPSALIMASVLTTWSLAPLVLAPQDRAVLQLVSDDADAAGALPTCVSGAAFAAYLAAVLLAASMVYLSDTEINRLWAMRPIQSRWTRFRAGALWPLARASVRDAVLAAAAAATASVASDGAVLRWLAAFLSADSSIDSEVSVCPSPQTEASAVALARQLAPLLLVVALSLRVTRAVAALIRSELVSISPLWSSSSAAGRGQLDIASLTALCRVVASGAAAHARQASAGAFISTTTTTTTTATASLATGDTPHSNRQLIASAYALSWEEMQRRSLHEPQFRLAVFFDPNAVASGPPGLQVFDAANKQVFAQLTHALLVNMCAAARRAHLRPRPASMGPATPLDAEADQLAALPTLPSRLSRVRASIEARTAQLTRSSPLVNRCVPWFLVTRLATVAPALAASVCSLSSSSKEVIPAAVPLHVRWSDGAIDWSGLFDTVAAPYAPSVQSACRTLTTVLRASVVEDSLGQLQQHGVLVETLTRLVETEQACQLALALCKFNLGPRSRCPAIDLIRHELTFAVSSLVHCFSSALNQYRFPPHVIEGIERLGC